MHQVGSYKCDGMRILEVGCGNGITVIKLARRRKVDILGIDFAAEMIAAAGSILAGQNLRGTAKFQVGDVPELSKRLQWKEGQDATYHRLGDLDRPRRRRNDHCEQARCFPPGDR